MAVTTAFDEVLSIEVFAAKDSSGRWTGVFLAVPKNCGLRQADTLRLDGGVLVAMRDRSIMPIDFPPLGASAQAKLREVELSGQLLAVGEFTALGLFDSYFLKIQSA